MDKVYEDFTIKGVVTYPNIEVKESDREGSTTYKKLSLSICFEKKAKDILKAKVDKIKKRYSKYKTPIVNYNDEQYEGQYTELKEGLPKEYSWRMKVGSTQLDEIKIQHGFKDCDFSDVKSGDYVVIQGALSISEKVQPRIVGYVQAIRVIGAGKYKIKERVGRGDEKEFDRVSQEAMEEFEQESDNTPIENSVEESKKGFESQLKEVDVPQ